MGISKESPYLKENLWNQAKWLDLLCWCPPSASNSIMLSSKNVTPKMLQKAYAPVDYVWFMSVACILCARACWMLSRRETNKGLGDHMYEKNSFSTIHLLHLYNNTSHIISSAAAVNKFMSDWEIRPRSQWRSWGAPVPALSRSPTRRMVISRERDSSQLA